jgi:hypothetical protein
LIGPFTFIIEEEVLELPFPPMLMSTPSYEIHYFTNYTGFISGATPEIFDHNGDFCKISFESVEFGDASFSNCSGSDEYLSDGMMTFEFDESYNTGLL